MGPLLSHQTGKIVLIISMRPKWGEKSHTKIKKGRQEIQNADEEGKKAQKDKCLINKKLSCRPTPKPPYILNTNGEVIGIIEREELPYVVPKTSPPLKPPRICGSFDREGIDQEKEYLLDTLLNHGPLLEYMVRLIEKE